MISHVLFDYDDTLTDRRQAIASLVGEMCQTFTLKPSQISVEFISGLVNRPAKDSEFFAAILHQSGLSKNLSPEELADFYWARSPHHFKLRSDGVSTLELLKARGYRLGIITDGKVDIQGNKLKASGILAHIREVLITDEVGLGVRKPDKRVIEHFTARYGLQTSEAVYVGDNPMKDIVGMKQLGLRAVWMRNGRQWEQDVQPDAIIDHLAELPGLLLTPKFQVVPGQAE